MRRRSPLALAALLVLAPAGKASPDRADKTDKAGEPAPLALRREVARLRLERELSTGKGFYLRLDAGQKRLSLMLQGIALDEYAASGLELGVPEVLFVDRRPPSDWDTAPISKGRLDPARKRDRIEVMAPAPAASTSSAAGASPAPSPSPPPIPKSAEESVSVPSPYRIVFAEGISLEVRSNGGGGRNRSALRRLLDAIGLRLSDLGSALGLGAHERVRLRVTLAAEDAAALYRSLPPDVSLVVAGLAPR